MCTGAICWCGIPGVVYGTSIETLREYGWPQLGIPCEEVSRRASPGGVGTTGGVLESERDALFEETAAGMEGVT
jgi:tRNA(adenine34) deaminase